MAVESLYTLIGDVVGSRESPDRAALQKRLRRTLRKMNQTLEPLAPLEPTLGDEFQGGFESASAAMEASLLIRLGLQRDAGIDTRYGLGLGSVEVFGSRRPLSQDGPGWWSAREAIEWCRDLAGAPGTRFVRTWFRAASESTGPREDEAALNAFLTCRDAMVDGMKQRTRNRLYGLMLGRSQEEMAREEGTTQGAISQSLARSNAIAILIAHRTIAEGPW